MELSETANAAVIVSRDADLTVLHPWRGIPILPPPAFLMGVHWQNGIWLVTPAQLLAALQTAASRQL